MGIYTNSGSTGEWRLECRAVVSLAQDFVCEDGFHPNLLEGHPVPSFVARMVE